MSPYGEPYLSAGIGVSTAKAGEKSLNASTGIGLSTNFDKVNVGVNAGISYSDEKSGLNASLLGASISSSSGKASLTAGGGSMSVHNMNQGKIQTESSGWSFTPPTPLVQIGVSYRYTRYWSDETENVSTNGVLYAPGYNPSLNNNAYDTYRLLDPVNENIIDSPDPDRVLGGTYPNYDDYSVTAQGLSGNIRPYNFQNTIYTQNKVDSENSDNDITANNVPVNRNSGNKLEYRFVNDFSNAYRQEATPFTNDFQYPTPIYGNNDGTYGYNPSTNRLEGSKHIEWFTNEEIANGALKTKDFIRTKSAGFTRRRDLDNQIGGFMITNASGVTYHYALPVYSYEEEVHTRKIEESTGNSLKKHTAYAYTWFLTAITGPDYVDRNNNKEVDEDDWGYWIAFDYGKWVGDYGWRNPSQGYHRDLDNEFQNYSMGKKELYYLDAVRTRSHTALFVKSIRADAKGSGRPTLKLDNIMLIANNELESGLDNIRTTSRKLDYPYDRGQEKVHFGYNVIDQDDIKNIPEEIKSKCIRNIVFNYNYSLNNGVFNSRDPEGARYTTLDNTIDEHGYLGKLTLLSVDLQGKGGESLLPSVEFEYELDANDPKNQDQINVLDIPTERKGSIQGHTTGKFEVGDIVKFTQMNIVYYCTLLKSTGNNVFEVLYLDKVPEATMANISAVKTKNPPYNKDAYDIWGLYKSDYQPGSGFNENLARITTEISNRSTDVWSLRKVKSAIGSDIIIDYEGDVYRKSVLNQTRALLIKKITRDGNGQYTMEMDNQGFGIDQLLSSGDRVDLILLKLYGATYEGFFFFVSSVLDSELYGYPTVSSVNGNNIVINVPASLDDAINSNNGAVVTGNMRFYNANRYYGGGVRVKSITVDQLNGHKTLTNYGYELLDLTSSSPSGSSGITSYEPIIMEVDRLNQLDFSDFANLNIEDAKKKYRKALNREMNYILSVARELPKPGVMYEYVTVNRSDLLPGSPIPVLSEGKTVYQYEVFNKNMLDIKEYSYEKTGNNERRNMGIKDYTSRIGNLKRKIIYDNLGNKINEQIHHYLHDAIAGESFDSQVSQYESMLVPYHYQGVVQERFSDARIVKKDGQSTDKRVMSGRDVYPAIQTGTTDIDYKNGVVVKQEIKAYDFYSGAVTKTLNHDSYGNRFMNIITPAYRVFQQMGLKTLDEPSSSQPHKHMLVQEASNYTFKVDGNNNPLALVSGNATVWGTDVPVLDPVGVLTTSQQGNIWRKKSVHQWLNTGINDGNLTPYSSFQDFHAPNQNKAAWKKISEVKKYNVYSAALEATDINNNHSASRMGYQNSKTIVSASNSRYHELAFSGLEDGLLSSGKTSSQVSLGQGEIKKGVAHTGEHSLLLAGGGNGLVYEVVASELDPEKKDYHAAVWVKALPGANAADGKLYYKLDGGSEIYSDFNVHKQAGGWYLLNLNIPYSTLNATSTLTIGCRNTGTGKLYFDDFRFQPLNAGTKAYVYDRKSGELTYALDQNNLYTKYEYDGVGRLVRIYREKIGKESIPLMREHIYNFGKSNAWTPTGNLRCQQINGLFTGLQEEELRNENPNSLTFNQTKWVLNSLKGDCVPTNLYPIWIETGKSRCISEQTPEWEDSSGYSELQEKDMNSGSPTYGQTQWVLGSFQLSCPQMPIYIKVIENTTQYPTVTYSARFYLDEAGTIPRPLDFDLTLKCKLKVRSYTASTNSNIIKEWPVDVLALKGTTSVYLGVHILYEEDQAHNSEHREFFMVEGLGYEQIYD